MTAVRTRMNFHEMRVAAPEVSFITNEGEMLGELLPLQEARVLELGCGKAEKTRIVAQKAASVLALEVDKIQLAENMKISDLPNVSFGHGGAENIPAPDSSFDVILMFRSLHHVPIELMDQAFSEIHRVLKPGGIVYISEPIFAGDFNEILKLFHNEKIVREAAFAAELRAISSHRMELTTQRFFQQPIHFENFTQFEEQVLKATHTDHKLSPELFEEVHRQFDKAMTVNGADFHMPIRVDLLKKAPQ